MPELLIPDMQSEVFRGLQERAAQRGRTAVEEAKAILADAVNGRMHNDWAPVDAIYHRLAAAGHFSSDSAELLREDRDR